MSALSSVDGTSITHSKVLALSEGRSIATNGQQDSNPQELISQRKGSINGGHLDSHISSDGADSSVVGSLDDTVNEGSLQSKSLPEILNNRVVTTEETVSSSLSSNSPQRNLPMMSSGPLPPIMSNSSGLGHESDDNKTTIDSNKRGINTEDETLVRPYHEVYNGLNDRMVAITREDSIINERETETEDEQLQSESRVNRRLLDDDNSFDVKGSYEYHTSNNNANNNKEVESELEEQTDNTLDNDNALPTFDIATFPTLKLLEMLTALLDKIVRSNDRLAEVHGEQNFDHETLNLNNRNNSHLQSILSFRGKHVPQISLEHYFQRIQKYCPTTNDVFLSLLVYFDRISKRCNSNYNNTNTGLGHNSQEEQQNHQQQQAFVMDSHNIHRLLIAGVTVSTKFFSDFFYSNSRYARVGGISLQELNHLELQFLVLCDFELLISTNELQRYADLLYKFWNSSNEVEVPQNSSVITTN